MKVELCIKCRRCGLPRKGHFDRKSRFEKQRIICRQPPKYPVATFQLAAVSIQKISRSFLIQRLCRRNAPIEKWQQKCVHYLSTKGPYGRNSKLDQYRRIAIYDVAVLQIQHVWSKYRLLKHLRLLGTVIRSRNAIRLQRSWRASLCRRYYAILRKSLRQPTESFLNLFGSETVNICGSPSELQNNVALRLGIASFPFTVYSRAKDSTSAGAPEGGGSWRIVGKELFIDYMCGQIKLKDEAQRRRMSKAPSRRRQRSTKDVAKELRRDRVRKQSERKFKWFYDRKEISMEEKEIDHSKSELVTKDEVRYHDCDRKNCNDEQGERSHSKSTLEIKDATSGDVVSDTDVMTWINDLHLDSYPDDL